MGKILLYYKYIDIEDPELIAFWQRQLCASLGLTGRIIIAHEGINGTVGGTLDAVEAYKEAMHHHPLFTDIIFKESDGSAAHFPKLRVMIKEEIVRLGISPQEIRAQDAAQHLSPKEVHEKIAAQPENLVILDARNNYESKIGTFAGAITPDISTFREFPEFIDNNSELFKDKEVLMFCTGGIRCERASAYLKSKGIAQNIYQLSGGIHCYLEQFPEGFFRGKNFVFDGRVSLATNEDILAECFSCQQPCDSYTHCVHMVCNKLLIMCDTCKTARSNTCSSECLAIIQQGIPVRTIPYKTEVHHES